MGCRIIDFNGFGVKNAMQFATSKAVLKTFSTHQPERLGVALLINPPSVFNMLLQVLGTRTRADPVQRAAPGTYSRTVHIAYSMPEGACMFSNEYSLLQF